jgi:hypothetical protein
MEDGWDTDPFTLTLVNDKLYGRGATGNFSMSFYKKRVNKR